MGSRSEHVQAERASLCATFTEAGPEASTLCEGWRTRELLQHLVVRESSVPGRLRRGSTVAATDMSWPELIDTLRTGPPPGSLFRIPGLDAAGNLEEFFIHHEDVRRARPAWQRRSLPDSIEMTIWRWLRSPFGRIPVRRSDIGVHAQRPDGEHVMLRQAQPGVVVRGRPSEILLYVFGRQSAADVELVGPAAACEALSAASLGM